MDLPTTAWPNGLPDRFVNDFVETKNGDYFFATNFGLEQFNPAPLYYAGSISQVASPPARVATQPVRSSKLESIQA